MEILGGNRTYTGDRWLLARTLVEGTEPLRTKHRFAAFVTSFCHRSSMLGQGAILPGVVAGWSWRLLFLFPGYDKCNFIIQSEDFSKTNHGLVSKDFSFVQTDCSE